MKNGMGVTLDTEIQFSSHFGASSSWSDDMDMGLREAFHMGIGIRRHAKVTRCSAVMD